MTRFLLHRPIAVFMVTLALLVFSVLALLQLPINLLPPIDVPSIIIKVSVPNGSPQTIENNILKPIRENLLTLTHLKEIESTAWAEAGQIHISFNYKANMDLMYIEVNERIDRLQNKLPPKIDRPKVMRLSTADIPVMRVQVIPKDSTNYVAVSQLASNVLKRRIEQIEGVSIVDVVGKQKTEIAIIPLFDKLATYNISLDALIATINASNINWGSISVKDGQYRYYIKLATILTSSKNILELPIYTSGGNNIKVKDVALVVDQVQAPRGFHLLNNKKGLAIIVHKQSNARMMELTAKIEESIAVFKEEYPQVTFKITQDQSSLLSAGITNLKTALLFGGVFAFAVLFIFMNNVRLAIIMGLSLPISLSLSFLLFYIFNISINIISLSGLALGLGMLIDNAIIVLDNITAKRKEGYDITTSCVLGVKEVQSPLISSVLTTIAVFVPLVFLHGMSGALFYDQAIAVSAILGVSLLVSFTVLPLLYKLLFSSSSMPSSTNKLFNGIALLYAKILHLAWQHKKIALTFIIMLCFTGFWLGSKMPKTVLPPIERNEFVLKIDWNEPIHLNENKQRVLAIKQKVHEKVVFSEAEIGERETLLGVEEYGSNRAKVYFYVKNNIAEEDFKAELTQWITTRFPASISSIIPAPNAFDQIFSNAKPFLVAKLRGKDSLLTEKQARLAIAHNTAQASLAKGFSQETSVKLVVKNERLALYNIDREKLQLLLAKIVGETTVTTLKSYGDNTTVSLQAYPQAHQNLNKLYIKSEKGVEYPISTFVKITYHQDYKYVTADTKGQYQAISFSTMQQVEQFMNYLKQKLIQKGVLVDFDGTYFESKKNLKQLMFVLIISFGLLYFILAAQFESFVQPLIIIFTLPLGIGGSLLLLYFTGSSLNIMSGIGIIVMLGIMINDAILKLATINRFRNNASTAILSKTDLFNLIHQAGLVRLRPILMTSLTTILALLPVLFTTGLGADLQRSLIIAVIGGLTVGTFTSLFFVPVMYYYLVKQNINRPSFPLIR